MTDTNLTDRYNDGLVPAPEPDVPPMPLRRPGWIPSPGQVTTARKRLGWNIAALVLVLLTIGILLSLAWSWGG